MIWGDYKSRVINIDKANLIAYYPMDEGSGDFIDLSGQNGDSTPVGVTYRNRECPVGTMASYFDGANDYAPLDPTNAMDTNFDGQNFTIMAWIYIGASEITEAVQRMAVSIGNSDATPDRIYIQKTNDNPAKLRCTIYADGVFTGQCTLNPAVAGWTNVIFKGTFASNDCYMFLNGYQQDQDLTYDDSFDNGNINPALTVIGAYNNTPTNVWKGDICHVAIWKTELSAAKCAVIGRP